MKSNDKKRARVEAMRHVLSLFDYEGKDTGARGRPRPAHRGPASDVFEQGEHTGRLFPEL